ISHDNNVLLMKRQLTEEDISPNKEYFEEVGYFKMRLMYIVTLMLLQASVFCSLYVIRRTFSKNGGAGNNNDKGLSVIDKIPLYMAYLVKHTAKSTFGTRSNWSGDYQNSSPPNALRLRTVTLQFNALKSELQNIAQKLGELESESEEHKAVIDTLAPLSGDRKCFRLVGGVLAERTVKDVLPALQTNYDMIQGVIDQLVKNYKKKEEEFIAFQKDNNIRVISRT
ncbi:17858_t:CDS:2, partial [Entrophospora sp. SA101]